MANVYQSQYAKIAIRALNTDSASYALTASYAMNGGSGGGSTDTGSLLKTASAAGNTITFTKGDGSTFPVTVAGGTGAPGGSDTQLQFNSASVFSGSSNLRFNYTNNTIYLTGSISASSGANTVGFFGTSSWAQSASQAISSSYTLSSSYALSASTSSFITASNVWGPFGSSSVQSASYASGSTSASYAATASYALASNPAPSDTYVQFNQNGAFGANADFAYIYTSSSLQQGSGTVALGQYSHTEGSITYTGLVNASSASISSGVVTLWDTYPDLSGDFLSGDYIIYKDISNNLSIVVVDSATYSSPNTIITLTDLSINVTSTIIGNANKSISLWTGDQTSPNNFGFSSHAEGTFTYALGVASHAEGRDTATFKEGSNTKGKGTVAIGDYQLVIGNYNALNTSSYSFIIGDGTADNNRHNLLFTTKSWFEVSASNVFLQGLPASPETHILVYNTSSGQVYYTASSAIGGGSVGGNFVPSSWTGSNASVFAGTASYVTGSIFTSTNPALSASYALTASHALNGGGSFTSTSSFIGNGLSSSFNINHGFNTRNLHITVYESGSNGETVYPDIRRINANTASIIFANPPTADQYIVYISI